MSGSYKVKEKKRRRRKKLEKCDKDKVILK